MQDPDTPPRGEGSINGAVGVARKDVVPAGVQWAASARNIRVFLRPRWITATGPISTVAEITATREHDARDFPRRIRCLIRSRFPRPQRMRHRESSLLWRICFS